jgi:hypothetical protein
LSKENIISNPTTLASRLKQRFNKEVSQLVPESSDMQRRLEFRKDLEQGASAEFDVSLGHEAGFSIGRGSVTLNGAVDQVSVRASVSGYSHILQSKVSYDLIKRANSDEKAFAKFADSKFLNMTVAMRNREELLALNGRRGVGKIQTENNSGVCVITKASWIPAFWASAVGAKFVAFDSLTGTTQHAGNITCTAVDIPTRTVTFTSDGTIADLAANDFIFPKGQHDDGRIGLLDIAYNTGSLYSINAGTYPLWAANSYDVGTSALTVGKILEASALAANKGASMEKLVCYVPPKTMQTLTADESALIRRDPNAKVMKSGATGIEIQSSTGTIEIVPHLLIPEGVAVIYPPDYTYFIGSCEATSQIAKDGDILFDLESSSDKEMRMFSDHTVFCERPGYIVVMTRSDSLALHE